MEAEPDRGEAELRVLLLKSLSGGVAARQTALDRLLQCPMTPESFAWFWLLVRTSSVTRAADLVDQLPHGLALTPGLLLELADELTAPATPAWTTVHLVALGKITLDERGGDLAVILARASTSHPAIAAWAINALAAMEPSRRGVIVELAEKARGHDARTATMATSLHPGHDAREQDLPDHRLAKLPLHEPSSSSLAGGAGVVTRRPGSRLGASLARRGSHDGSRVCCATTGMRARLWRRWLVVAAHAHARLVRRSR